MPEAGLIAYASVRWTPESLGTGGFWCYPEVLLRCTDPPEPPGVLQFDAEAWGVIAAPAPILSQFHPPPAVILGGEFADVERLRKAAEDLIVRVARCAIVFEHALRTLHAASVLSDRELSDARSLAAVSEVLRG